MSPQYRGFGILPNQGLSLVPKKKKTSRAPAYLDFNSAPASQYLLSVAGQPVSFDHPLPSVTCNPAPEDLRLC